ncbi:AfsR/SARP family transcriptional regulator [Streptomyces solicathayae]|uniref:BTAD domain-containing putative transcriptional regulator n=1 Tax=Streptomyces solicathayae TaxID=3081768 RepID=A0ABZ0M3Y3_9ACTN|nr:BTAD domain-containing putative transcriptional regulator [Streptomyces sp. HUAS YS2]WOX26355.1 BTAD domain-containing putative transcriptional regulator [Streptomyces sp. HUAS YS2]
MGEVECRVLGGVEVLVRGRAVDLGHARQRHVLAVLLVEVNQPLSAGKLIERVWGERAPRSAVSTLYSYVSRLRGSLSTAGAGLRLARHSGGYEAQARADVIDLHRFRSLVARARGARDQEAGELLRQALVLFPEGDAFPVPDTPWFTHLGEVLATQRQAVELDLGDVLLRQGREAELLPRLLPAVAAQPYDERLAGQLMLALHRQGRTVQALEHYQSLRRSLDEELGLTPGAAVQHLHQQLLGAGGQAVRPPEAGVRPEGVVRPEAPVPPVPHVVPVPPATTDAHVASGPRAAEPVAVPRQLPLAPAGFIGRRLEREQLAKAFGRIVVVSGPGGVGKSWLAACWAYEEAGRFPDGQLYADLRGYDAGAEPLPPSDVLRGFLEALGVRADAVPEDQTAREGLYRSLLADRRALVVLDDAYDAGQVLPLLPGTPTCTVLITSRNRLSSLVVGHGAISVSPAVFDDRHAGELLAERLGAERTGAEPEAVASLVKYCAGLPLALSLVAARAAAHPGFPLAALAGELADATGRLDALDTGDPAVSLNLRAVLAMSRRALSAPARRLFDLLGLVPGPDAGVAAVASLAGVPRGRARLLLAELESAHLVHQHVPGRYLLHDLVRLYARECVASDEAGERADATARFVDFHLHTAYAAIELLDGAHTPFKPERADPPAPGCAPWTPPDFTAAHSWFAEEHACLVATQELALSAGLHVQAVHLAWTLISYQLGAHRLPEYARVWQTALTAAERQPASVPRILAHWRLGHFHALSGRHSEGLDHLHRALVLAEDAGDTAGRAHIHRTLARIWELHRDDRRALDHATEALRLYEELANPFWLANQLNAVGWLHARLGEYAQGRAYCEQAYTLHVKHGRPGDEASTLDSLGYISHQTGDHAAALGHYREALAQFQATGDGANEADTLAHIAETLTALDRPNEARVAWSQALDLYRSQDRAADSDRAEAALAALPLE